MDISTIIPHIEAIIFASDKPVTTIDLVELINNAMGFMEDRANLDQIESALDAIREKYNSDFYPFHVMQSGGGWQFLTKPAFHATVAQLNGQKFLKKLSSAALEVLSIIAYKQPVTKGEMEEIRGVNCDYAVQKLLEKDLVIITGRKENAPGQPLIYATSKTFMDYFGINSTSDLPQLRDVSSQEVVNPTTIGTSNRMDTDIPMDEEGPKYVVNESGKIIVTEETGNGDLVVDIKPGDGFKHTPQESDVTEENTLPQDLEQGPFQDSEADEPGTDISQKTDINQEKSPSLEEDVETAEVEANNLQENSEQEPTQDREPKETNNDSGEDANPEVSQVAGKDAKSDEEAENNLPGLELEESPSSFETDESEEADENTFSGSLEMDSQEDVEIDQSPEDSSDEEDEMEHQGFEDEDSSTNEDEDSSKR